MGQGIFWNNLLFITYLNNCLILFSFLNFCIYREARILFIYALLILTFMESSSHVYPLVKHFFIFFVSVLGECLFPRKKLNNGYYLLLIIHLNHCLILLGNVNFCI